MKYFPAILFFLFLLACGSPDINNIQYFSEIPSIIVSENDQEYVKNKYTEFTSESLDTAKGPCGFASYMIDFDNQPQNTPPFEIGSFVWENFPLSSFKMMSGEITDSYTELMLGVSDTIILNQYFFFSVKQNVPAEEKYRYELLCNTDSIETDSITNIKSTIMFLRAEKIQAQNDTVKITTLTPVVFDLSTFLENQIQQGNDSFASFKLKYASRTNSEGNIVYAYYSKNPIKIVLNP